MTRLETLRQYLAEAKLDPDNNKLYIEDLEASIEMESVRVNFNQVNIMNGWQNEHRTRSCKNII